MVADIDRLREWIVANGPPCDQWDYIHVNLQTICANLNISPPYGNWGLLEQEIRQYVPNVPCSSLPPPTIALYRFPANLIAREEFILSVFINQGSITWDYKLIFSGGITAESVPFTVNSGTGLQEVKIPLVFDSSGDKIVCIALVKVV